MDRITRYKDDVFRDWDVVAPNVFFESEQSSGQGCETLWFYSVPEARRFIEKHGRLTGKHSGLCSRCRCYYSPDQKKYTKYPEYACKKWKDSVVKVPRSIRIGGKRILTHEDLFKMMLGCENTLFLMKPIIVNRVRRKSFDESIFMETHLTNAISAIESARRHYKKAIIHL
jgi:hypothetical protein